MRKNENKFSTYLWRRYNTKSNIKIAVEIMIIMHKVTIPLTVEVIHLPDFPLAVGGVVVILEHIELTHGDWWTVIDVHKEEYLSSKLVVNVDMVDVPFISDVLLLKCCDWKMVAVFVNIVCTRRCDGLGVEACKPLILLSIIVGVGVIHSEDDLLIIDVLFKPSLEECKATNVDNI